MIYWDFVFTDIKALTVWRYDDPVFGPRKMPQFNEYKTGKSILGDGVFSVDFTKQEIYLKNVNVGRNFIYVVD